VEWYEHRCPRHGVIVRYSRDESVRPAIPITCPRTPGAGDCDESGLRCNERLHLRIVPDEQSLRSA
jgi:hypothetical protein